MTMSHIPVEIIYFVCKWKSHQQGYKFDLTPSGIIRTGQFNSLTELVQFSQMRICIPIDPVTAIAQGLVTPEELGMPPGLEAAYNLLK